MALQSSGQISLNDVNVELGNSGTAQIDMNSSDVRGLFEISSGEIEMADGYGKSDAFVPQGTHIQRGGSNGATGTVSLTNTQAGDFVIAICGSLTLQDNTLISGFTSLQSIASSTRWNPNDANHYTNCRMQYKILNGNETSFTCPAGSGGFSFHQLRFPTAPSNVNSINWMGTFGGSLSANHNSETVAPIAVLRAVGQGGYGVDSSRTRSISNLMSGLPAIDSNYSHGTPNHNYSAIMVAVNYNATTMTTNGGAFNSPSLARTMKLT